MMMMMMMCDPWIAVSLLSFTPLVHRMEKTGYIFMLEGLLVKTVLMASQDFRGMKEMRELLRGLTDFFHPTHSERTG